MAATLNIIDVFAKAKQEDLDAIREKIADLEKELAALHAIEKALDVRINGKTKRKSPERKITPVSSNGVSDRQPPALEAKRQRVADYLRANGAKGKMKLSEATGISLSGPGCLAVVLDSPQFHISSDGIVSLIEKRGGL